MAKSKKQKRTKKRTGKKPLRFNPPAFALWDDLLKHNSVEGQPGDPMPDEIVFELTHDRLLDATLGTGQTIEMESFNNEPVNGQAMEEALDKYQSALEKLNIALPLNTVMSRDIIDIRAMSTAIKADPFLYAQHMAFMFASDPFFNAVPCFTKGVLLEPDDAVAVWELLNIDVEKKTYTIKVDNYLHSDAFGHKKTWFLSDTMTTVISTGVTESGEGKYIFRTKVNDILERPQMYRAINLNALDFTDAQRHAFNKGLLAMSDWHSANMLSRSKLAGFMFSQLSFVYVITAVNMFLEQQAARKPSKERLATLPEDIQKLEPKEKPVAVSGTETPPTRKVRVVDMISFASENIPRRPTEKTVVKYITPAWQVRGHTRHYKSGKTAYIPPHINRRKTLKDKTDTGVPQQIIRIRDNTDFDLNPEE